MADPKKHFIEVAPPFMHLLLEDFPTLGRLDAAAVFGNLGHESGGLTKLQEINPTVAGSKGGYGWAQWTGPRRRAYEAYCARNGKDPAAPSSNYAFLFLELKGPESRAISALKSATTLYEKTEAFERSFERAGIKHYTSRNHWALVALEAYETWLAERPDTRLPVTKENEMDGIKKWYQSKGVVAGLGAIAALIGPVFGLDLGQTNINDAVIAVNELVAAIAAVVAVYGRVTANSKIQ